MSRKPPKSPNLPLGGVPTSPEAPRPPEAVPTPPRAAQTPRGGVNPEIQCMARVDRLLAELPPRVAKRIIRWLDDRYHPYTNEETCPNGAEPPAF